MGRHAAFSLGFLFAEPQTPESIQIRLRGDTSHRRSSIKVLPRFVCSDGFSFSVQASSIHGSQPQNETGPYSTVECGALSEPVPDLLPFMQQEDGIPPEHGIYRHVPVELIVKVVNDHGGLVF